MKHTLETIRKALNHHVETQDAVSFGYLKHEIEGFEKELREKLANADMSPLIHINEILGEKEA